MERLKYVLSLNGLSLGISLTEVEQYLQIGILIISGIISIIASIKQFQNGKKK